ncbi:GNAT family N-acetyltransferase [Alicyclobacillus acidocaldarius]|uniref:GCN5-related N-acetyltransferase n=1 Tax=Alicyclobacillus acidocaldarius subsp. acidocaldarius (strain ATCC 27009 / DSM 446 / BCRC 14685 / JCM 5260 / KCTC 1825 / NBRC 15652 / NCIMB 11725 / NRRL B-14509 / 104-IA) TaxID=521098 RepID=C8WXX8_ALIAD|nr:GNAT family N-acetyltransferase [Alicyclobacillus acidocaldarius]ACV58940.1 GCN5-related N-acetyltransferase [Alicyclobacillus acidocaldarius subsp. acidocaldarius DSM 446]
MNEFSIRRLAYFERPPIDLLVQADPDVDVVNQYISRGITYVGELDGNVIGCYVLLQTRPMIVELVNVAVAEDKQGQGYGKQLIQHAVQQARSMGYKSIEIGTGNSSIGQLALYQKCGFRIVGVDFDFFTRHYKEPIFENGIQCRDMIRLVQHIE